MSFQILDYLTELETYGEVIIKPTWIQATCPVCGGKLKITKNPQRFGAYACYTNNCHQGPVNRIRQALYKDKPFSPSNAFKPKSIKPNRLVEIVEPVEPKAEAKNFLTKVPFKAPKQVRERNKIVTYFEYDGFRVVRLDTRLQDGTKRKYIYPEYKLPTGDYVHGLPSRLENLPIYTSTYLQPAMVFVEGEKTATIGQKLGLATVTLPTFAFSEMYINAYAKELRGQGLTDVLYLEDNDKAGKKKADLVSTHFWKQGIGTKVVNLVDLFTNYEREDGFDLYDAYREKLVNENNISNVIEELLAR